MDLDSIIIHVISGLWAINFMILITAWELVPLPEQPRTEMFSWYRTALCHVAFEMMPKTNISVKELDQAAALFAEAIVLGFTVYDIAKYAYQNWLTCKENGIKRHKF